MESQTDYFLYKSRLDKLLDELFHDGQATLQPAPSNASENAEELQERFLIMHDTLLALNRMIEERQESVAAHRQSFQEGMRSIAAELEDHARTWSHVEANPSATERRTFLQGQLLHLKENLCRVDLEGIDKAVELRARRDALLHIYVQLRRIVKSVEAG